MMISTKLIVTGAASLLGVALAASGAYAATGSLSVSDAPGQVLKISGVAPAAAHANQNAIDHANENAKGLIASIPKAPKTDGTDADTSTDVKTDSSTDVKTDVTPVAPSEASKDASTVKGSATGQGISAWAHEKSGVEIVAPPAAVTIESGAAVGADASAQH